MYADHRCEAMKVRIKSLTDNTCLGAQHQPGLWQFSLCPPCGV